MQPIFFRFFQNNSGGDYDVNENVSPHVIIQAYSKDDAISLLNPMIENQSPSCSCCGSRWDIKAYEMKISNLKQDGEEVAVYGDNMEKWQSMFGKFTIIDAPIVKENGWGIVTSGIILIDTLDARIRLEKIRNGYFGYIVHYLNGTKQKI